MMYDDPTCRSDSIIQVCGLNNIFSWDRQANVQQKHSLNL